MEKVKKLKFNILTATILFLLVSSIPACSQAEKAEKSGGEAPAKVDAAQKEKILEGLKTSFICPSSNASIAEALAEGLDCPVGTQLLEIAEVLLDAGWPEDKVKSVTNNFKQGRDLSFFVVDRPALGDKDAPVTMVEFTDMQCPYCGRYFNQTFSTLKTEYVDTGKLRYYQLNLPLPFHQFAQKGAEALYCANEEGKYWDLRAIEFTNQKALSVEDIKKYAKELGLKEENFNACLDSSRYAAKVGEDMRLANQAGISGTPGFVIAVSRTDGKIRGNIVSGAQPTETFKAAIEGALAKAKAK
ncbi:MAG: thioredoxin domain-containing protein [bacterium]